MGHPSHHQQKFPAQQPPSPIPQQYPSLPHSKDNCYEEKEEYQPNCPSQVATSSASAPPPLYTGQRMTFSRDIKQASVVSPVPTAPEAPSQNSKPMRAKALYAFTSDQEGDLSFEAGDVIYVTEKTDSQNDWWTGRLRGQLGSVSKKKGTHFEHIIMRINASF